MKVLLNPNESGVEIDLQLVEGKVTTPVPLPLSKTEIEELYKVPGFIYYVAWEELFESDLLDNSVLKYEDYYRILTEEDGVDILQQLGLPIEEMKVTGELLLKSLPQDGDVKLELRDEEGKILDRVGKQTGSLFQRGDILYLLPESIFSLKQAILADYENGYQKVGVCQQFAKEAGIKLENFLENESYHVLDHYDIDVKVHSHDHIELLAKGSDQLETEHLNQLSTVGSVKNGFKRDRFVKTNDVTVDLQNIFSKKHITGEDVPVFLENPSAILPEHDYLIDLEAFSERVRGLIPIERVRPSFGEGTGITWFSEESGDSGGYDPDFLKELMEKYPNQQYVEHKGKWIYLDPTLRKKLLDLPADEENKIKQHYALDIKDNEEQLDFLIDSNNDKKFNAYPIPSTLQADLFEHQVEGFQWLCHLEEQGIGGLLADDMGLGKTIQVITFLLQQKQKQTLKPTLVVLPIALIENWIEEIQKFAPGMAGSMYIHKGSSRLKSSEMISQYDLVFTSYDTLKIDQLLLGKIKFHSIICDEAQNVKSHSSQRSRALRAMQSNFRLAMTGTPVENSLEELWAIMDFVQPGELGSLREFRKAYIQTSDYVGLLDKIRPFYLRRTKKEVLDDRLPTKHDDIVKKVEVSKVQRSIASSMLQTKETGQIAILNMLMRLRQLYGHPGVIIPDYETLPLSEVPKLEKLIEIIDKVKQKNEKVLIFTEFRKLHSILKRIFMQRYGIPVPVIDGETNNRQSVVKMFNKSPGFGVMILSQKAAGVGLTITSANHVVHYTRWWNPAVENQATDRAYRIGQEKDVYVYQIITTDQANFPQGTVEELMHELLERKRELAENVIVPFNMSEMQKEIVERLAVQNVMY
ncbi:DEAD/DEAH box helicase [Neobacillus mesonae]|nr:DEAD/DEAH box helicase [Neobacillus mesonae]